MELKPCPFCGGEAKYFAYSSGGVCIKCMDCLCQTQTYSDYCIADCKKHSAIEMAIETWNNRHNQANVANQANATKDSNC